MNLSFLFWYSLLISFKKWYIEGEHLKHKITKKSYFRYDWYGIFTIRCHILNKTINIIDNAILKKAPIVPKFLQITWFSYSNIYEYNSNILCSERIMFFNDFGIVFNLDFLHCMHLLNYVIFWPTLYSFTTIKALTNLKLI